MELTDGSTVTNLPADVPLYFAEYVQALEARAARLEGIVEAVEKYRASLPFSVVHIRNELQERLTRV